MRNKKNRKLPLGKPIVGAPARAWEQMGAAIFISFATAGVARAQYFINLTSSGSGSAMASGTGFPGGQAPDTESFTGVNTSVSAGNHLQSWADVSNSLTVSRTVLSASATSDADWYGSSSFGFPWIPNSTDSASLTVSFQVATARYYKLDPSGSGPFATSQQLNQQNDQATLVGKLGGATVLSISMSNGLSSTMFPGTDLFMLTPGTQYTLTLSCSGTCAPWNGQSALPNYLHSSFTATPYLQSATWTNAVGDFSWNDASGATNWNPSGVLSAQSAMANFTPTGAGTVTLDGNQTVGKINLNSAASYTFNRGTGGTLTIDDSADAVVTPQINVGAGFHTINSPIILVAGVNINFSNNSGLTIGNTITGAGPMSVNGGGTLTVATTGLLNPSDTLSITTGAHVVLAPTAAPTTPNIQTVAQLTFDFTGSRLDVGNNEMIVTSSIVGLIADQVGLGYNGGTWAGANGIISSTAQVNRHYGVGYISNGSGGVEMRYTLYGDCNLDASVNFADLLTLAQNYGSTNATWSNGDFNYDQTVNFADLLALAQNYNASLTPGEIAGFSPAFAADWNLALAETNSVPEPSALGLFVIGASCLLMRRRLFNT